MHVERVFKVSELVEIIRQVNVERKEQMCPGRAQGGVAQEVAAPCF